MHTIYRGGGSEGYTLINNPAPHRQRSIALSSFMGRTPTFRSAPCNIYCNFSHTASSVTCVGVSKHRCFRPVAVGTCPNGALQLRPILSMPVLVHFQLCIFPSTPTILVFSLITSRRIHRSIFIFPKFATAYNVVSTSFYY